MLNVLIIEDDAVMLKAIDYILRKNEYNTFVAHNGKEAFEIIEREHFDLVITDLMMPFNSGLEVISRVRNHPGSNNAGIIVISAMGQEATIREAFELGADDYMIKPIQVGELLSRIHRLTVSKNNVAGINNNTHKDKGKAQVHI